MASPFAVFRRNQKLLLAIVAIGAMIAFVFLQPLVQYMSRSGVVENPVVVETEYGPLKQTDLYGMIETRRMADLLLRNLTTATVEEAVRRDSSTLAVATRSP